MLRYFHSILFVKSYLRLYNEIKFDVMFIKTKTKSVSTVGAVVSFKILIFESQVQFLYGILFCDFITILRRCQEKFVSWQIEMLRYFRNWVFINNDLHLSTETKFKVIS